MKVGLNRSGRGQKQLERQTSPVDVVVTEPPTAGRPSGYQLGDVGRFTLHATVEPRQCRRGEAISVVAKLEGSGNFPLRLRLPQQRGVEWLEPTTLDALEPKGSSLVGSRRFTYVARLEQSGKIELGTLRLPYWDLERHSYAVAKAELGAVEVAPARPGDSPDPAGPTDPLKEVLVPRVRLGAPAVRVGSWGDLPWFWGALAAGPASVLLLRGGLKGGRALVARWRARKKSLEHRVSVALADAKRADAAQDLAGAANALERALYLAIENATGLRARGLLRGELEARLEAEGLPRALGQALHGLLQDCDALRYTGSRGEAGSDWVERAEKAVAELSRFTRGRSSRGRE
jgi:hypothetical protein